MGIVLQRGVERPHEIFTEGVPLERLTAVFRQAMSLRSRGPRRPWQWGVRCACPLHVPVEPVPLTALNVDMFAWAQSATLGCHIRTVPSHEAPLPIIH
jgi:hypothetical protein